MKMSKEMFEDMKYRIDHLIATLGLSKIHAHYEFLKTDERVKDIDKRFRWDLLNAINRYDGLRILDMYDDGLNDTHIDSALKAYMKDRHYLIPSC